MRALLLFTLRAGPAVLADTSDRDRVTGTFIMCRTSTVVTTRSIANRTLLTILTSETRSTEALALRASAPIRAFLITDGDLAPNASPALVAHAARTDRQSNTKFIPFRDHFAFPMSMAIVGVAAGLGACVTTVTVVTRAFASSRVANTVSRAALGAR